MSLALAPRRQRQIEKWHVVADSCDGDDVVLVAVQGVEIGTGLGQGAQHLAMPCVSRDMCRRATAAVTHFAQCFVFGVRRYALPIALSRSGLDAGVCSDLSRRRWNLGASAGRTANQQRSGHKHDKGFTHANIHILCRHTRAFDMSARAVSTSSQTRMVKRAACRL